MLMRMITLTAVVIATFVMMTIAGVDKGNFLTGLMWVGAFLVLFLLPGGDPEEDE